MRYLFVLALLCAPLAHAQVTYTPTPGSGYLPLSGATVRGSVSIRTNNAAPPVTYVLDGVDQNTENTAPIDFLGDLTLWDTTKVADGTHVLKAGSHTATFAVANASPEPPTGPTWTGSQGLSWTPPTLNDDGTPLTDLAGYLIQYGNAADALNLQVRLTNPALTSYRLTGLPQGRYYAGMRAFTTSGVESDLSNIIQFQLTESLPTCPPKPADETRVAACQIGATGSWTQTRTYAEAIYPTCWTGSEWLPASAPAGACVVPPATWKVKAIASGTRPATELVRNKADTGWVLGYKLGDVAVGKPCEVDPLYRSSSTTEYHRVTETDVVLLSPTYRGRTLVAVCAK